MASIAAERRSPLTRDRLWDVAERAAVLVLFASFAVRNYHAVVDKGQWFNAILVASEALNVIFILIRRPALEMTRHPLDWALAFAATVGPLMAMATGGGHPLVPPGAAVALLLMGFALQVWAKLTLRRSFGIVPANRGVKAGGPYRFVRHPMYLGYISTHVGFVLISPNPWNAAVYGVSLAIQLFRILAEERLLSLDPAYVAFKTTTRWRLLPGMF